MPDTAVVPPRPIAGSRVSGSRPGGGNLPLLRDPDHYEEINVIGTGAYGTVYKARDTVNDTIVAIKKVKLGLTEDGVPMQVLREISLLKQLGKANHPNIVRNNNFKQFPFNCKLTIDRLLDICHGQRLDREMVLYLVFEHVDQDLNTYIEKCPSPGLGPDRVKDIIWQILNGVDFLHSNRIVHRDLKPQNILVSRDCSVKLADFGLARIYDFSSLLTTVVVTLWYRSPEVLLGNSYATPVDLWSCGCIFAELFLRKPLFPGQYEIDQLNQIFQILGTPSVEEWPSNSSIGREAFASRPIRPMSNIIPEMDQHALDLLQKLLVFNSDDRISAGKALLHPYFAEFGFHPTSHSPDLTSESSHSGGSMSEGGASSDANTSLSPVTTSTSFSSHETSGESFGDLSGVMESNH